MPLPLIPLAISGLSALGGLFGNRKAANTGTTSSNYNNTSSVTPNINPQDQNFLNQIRQRYAGLINDDPDLSGYHAQGLQQINQDSNIKQKALSNLMASRGLSYGAAGVTPIANLESDRISQTSQFSNSIPLLARQMLMQNLQSAGQFSSTLPRGYTQTSSGTSQGEQVNPNSASAGLFGNLGQTLAYLYGRGAFGGTGGNS